MIPQEIKQVPKTVMIVVLRAKTANVGYYSGYLGGLGTPKTS